MKALTFRAAIQFSTLDGFKVRANNELVNNCGQNGAVLQDFFDLRGVSSDRRKDHEVVPTVSLAGLQNPTFEQGFKFPFDALKNLNTKAEPPVLTDYTGPN